MIKYTLILFTALFLSGLSKAQVVYQHTSNRNIYEFVDELANQQIIEINSVIKPYSRKFISEKLFEAQAKSELLNKRQRKELDFYLLEFGIDSDQLPEYSDPLNFFKNNKELSTTVNPMGLHYKDSLFTISIKPVWGINYFINNNESIYHRWGLAEGFAYIGKHVGFYANLRDNNETKVISNDHHFNLRTGGNYKLNSTGGGDYSEMRGGISYAWDWGHVALVKDHVVWGNNYHGSNIFSEKPPSFTQLKFQATPVKWLEFNYFHAWLVSEVVDSTHSYYNFNGIYRAVFYPKFMAANMFTFIPFKQLHLSLGNSIVYSDNNVHPVYLIPVMFYKSIDHTLIGTTANATGQNSQMFFDISSRQIKNLHLFFTLFVDELKLSRISDPDEHNFLSYKGGAKYSNILNTNISVVGEFTRTLPMTYQHFIMTTTFETNNFNLGHYLRDNSQEIYFEIMYKPIRGLHINLSYLHAMHGEDFVYGVDTDGGSANKPILEDIKWENTSISIKADYEILNNTYLFFEFINSNVNGEQEYLEKYTPAFFRGAQNYISTGFNIGF